MEIFIFDCARQSLVEFCLLLGLAGFEESTPLLDDVLYPDYPRIDSGRRRAASSNSGIYKRNKPKLYHAGYKTKNAKPPAYNPKSNRHIHDQSSNYVGGTPNEQLNKAESLDTGMQRLELDTDRQSRWEGDTEVGGIIQDFEPSSNPGFHSQLFQVLELERRASCKDYLFDSQSELNHLSDDKKAIIETDAGHGLRRNDLCKQLGEADQIVESSLEHVEQVGQTGSCEPQNEQKPELKLEQIPRHPAGFRSDCRVVESHEQYEAQLSTGYQPIFPRFRELPAEVRMRIFEFAGLSWGPNTVSMYCLPRTKTTEKTIPHTPSSDPPSPLSKDSKDVEPREVPDDWPWELRAHYKIPPLLHTNFEARKTVQKYYKLSFGYQLSTKHGVWFDFAQDRLIMESGGAFDLFKHGAEDTEQDRVQLTKVEKDLRFLILKDLTPSDVVGLCEYADGLQKLQNLYLLKAFEAQYKDLEDYFFYRVELELIKSWGQALESCRIQQLPRLDILDNKYFRAILDLSDGEGAEVLHSTCMPYPTASDLADLRRKPRHRHLASMRRQNVRQSSHLTMSGAEEGIAKV
jgi:hypothetical protein